MSRVYRATLHGTHFNGVLVLPSFHYQTDVPFAGDEPDPSDVAEGVWDTLAPPLLAVSPNDVQFTEVSVTEQVLPPAIGVAGSYAPGAGTGSLTPDGHLPLAVVPVCNMHTDTASRSARGWVHLASPRKSTYNDDGIWTGTMLSLLTDMCARIALHFDLGTAIITHVNPVVYSRTRHLRGESPYTFRITSATPQHQCRWLRSRLSTP